MSLIKVSLIVASRYRTAEVQRLLESLVAQTYKAFEVIVVDQNDDERLVPVLEAFTRALDLRHVRSKTLGHAAANNVGLRLCEGTIIGFPDDDCWYIPDLLFRIVGHFDAHPEWLGITGCEAPSENAVRNDRFDRVAGRVNQANIMRRHISFAAFYRKEMLAGLSYDERMGPGAGTIWGAGEETQFLLEFMKAGGWVQYDPALIVYHPDWGNGPYTKRAIAKAYWYGMSMGRILQAHRFPVGLTLRYLYRPFWGGFYTMIVGNPKKAVYHWSIFAGRVCGWFVSLWLNHTWPRVFTTGLSTK